MQYTRYLNHHHHGTMTARAAMYGLLALLAVAGAGIIVMEMRNNEATLPQEKELFHVSIPANYTEPLVIASFGNLFNIQPINAKSSEMVKTGENTVKYIEAYTNTDVEQVRYPNKLKESLILKGPKHPDRFEYELNMVDYLWEIDSEGNIIFRDKKSRDFSAVKAADGRIISEAVARNLLETNQKMFIIPKPFMVEKKDIGQEWKMGVERGEVAVVIEGSRLILTPDAEWLKKHSYPIVVDPTVQQIGEPVVEVNEDGFIPIEPQKWQSAGKTNEFQKRIGGAMASYEREDGTWAEIENNWVVENDNLISNQTDLIKTKVANDGESQITLNWQGKTYTVSQKLEKLVWLDTQTEELTDIGNSLTWQTPNIEADTIGWTDIFPGIDYKVKKENSQVQHQIHFKPEFLDQAVSQYDVLPNNENIALGNAMVYELTNVDNANEPIGDVYERIFKDLGAGYIFQLNKQYLHFPGEEEARAVPVIQKWIAQDNKIYCIEYVMMDEIEKIHEEQPEAVIWHNVTSSITGTTNVEDAVFSVGAADSNYGAATTFIVRSGAVDTKSAIKVNSLDSILGPGVTISAASVYAYCTSNDVDGNISAYRLLKPWVEGDENGVDNDDGDITWNDWASDGSEWGTAGALNASDAGTDNSGDGTGYDTLATAESTTNVTTVSTWYSWSVSAALAQGWYDGTFNENGVLLNSASTRNTFNSAENTSNPAYWSFTYTVAAGNIAETGNNSTGGSANPATITHGLTINEGDVIVALVTLNVAGENISDGNGSYPFTEVFTEDNPDQTSMYSIFSRVAGASEPASYTFQLGGNWAWSLLIRVFSGVDNDNVWDVTPSASTRSYAGSGTTATAPTMTTSNDGAMGITFFISDSTITWSNPTNNYGAGIQNSTASAASYKRIWETAGPTGSAAATLSATNDWVAHQVALKLLVTNSAPTVSSVSDSPDPAGVGTKVSFTVDWNDADSGTMAAVRICQGSGITTSTMTCKDGTWAGSDGYTNRDPEAVNYTTVAADKGNTRNYWAFVCDNNGTVACSDGTAGTFTVANQRPDASVSMQVEGIEIGNVLNLTDATPEFSAIYKDSLDEGDVAEKYCIEVDTQADFAGTDMWISDSASCYTGSALAANVNESQRTAEFSYAGTALTLSGGTYYWRLWLWDGEERGATSTTGWFNLANQSAGWGTRLKGLLRLKGGVRLK